MDNQDKKELTRRVIEAIDSIKPYLQVDGGDVTFVEITDDMIVKVKLLGACHSCPFSLMTLKAGIEQTVKERVPEIKEIVAVD